MKIYFVKKYYSISLLCSIIILLFGFMSGAFATFLEGMLKSFSYGAVIGLYLAHKLFQNRNLWVLYDNLLLNKYRLLLVSIIGYLSISYFGIFIINKFTNGI